MFKIKESTIHCSRGDSGAFTLKIPIMDANNNVKYKDINNGVYWYNTKKDELYDSNYNLSETSKDSLSMVYYKFQIGDTIKLSIYERNGYDKEPLMTKIISVTEEVESVYVELTEEDTTFGKINNKPVTFWYDITLNDYLTVVCYDEDGAKEFIMYPAKGDDE